MPGLIAALLLIALAAPDGQQQPPTNATPPQPAGTLLGRPSPPQPKQTQGLDYFVGTWSLTWTGRESPLTPGPRTGRVTYARAQSGPSLTATTTGQIDGGRAYTESATLDWDPAKKVLAMRETLSTGVEVSSTGDWSSPIAIKFESAPVTVQGQRLVLRRVYGIVSAQSFTVNEELSTNGGPFVRLGGGVFKKGG